MSNIAKIDVEQYFRDGQESLLRREKDINLLLLQLTVIINKAVDWIDECGEDKRIKSIIEMAEESRSKQEFRKLLKKYFAKNER